MNNTYIQVRTNAEDKKAASDILENMGTNISTVVNMLLKQIIATKSIPFDCKLDDRSEQEKATEEIRAIMDAVTPGDTIKLAMEAKTEEDRIFYERLGDYLLQVGQKMCIERNVY